MEGRAQRAWPESTRTQQDQLRAAIVREGRILQQVGPIRVRHASCAQQMLVQLRLEAQRWQLAGATRATLGSLEARAQRAWLEHTRTQRDQLRASTVQQGPRRRRGAQL
jgi:hypothetical protein